MASLDFAAETEAFREYYAANEARLRNALQSLTSILQMLLSDHDDFATPVVTARLKNREECIAKFERKYRAHKEKIAEPYTLKDTITDILGLRVVCLHEPDIALVANLVKENFKILGTTDKTKDLEDREDAFGYKGYHLDFELMDPRRSLPEYMRLNDLRFELQIRTIVQDAWATIDHKIKYKKNIPLPLKRRINRLAALFDLADQEFLHVHQETRELESALASAAPPSVVTPPITQSPPASLDAFQFMQFARETFLGYPFEPAKIEDFVDDLLELHPTLTMDDVRSAWTRAQAEIEEYRAYLDSTLLLRLNPYTKVRHALFEFDQHRFRRLLFNNQHETFLKWKTSRGKGA